MVCVYVWLWKDLSGCSLLDTNKTRPHHQTVTTHIVLASSVGPRHPHLPLVNSMECNYYDCDETGKSWEFPRDNHCSHDCYYRDRGNEILRHKGILEADHRNCSTCRAFTKEVEHPPDGHWFGGVTEDAVIGYQYPTQHAYSGRYGLECECGNVNHYHSEETIREKVDWIGNLDDAMAEYKKEGKIDSFDISRFVREYYEYGCRERAFGVSTEF